MKLITGKDVAMNITEKILAKAAGKKAVAPGEIIDANLDMVMIHDLTGPLAVESFKKIGTPKVWDSKKVVVILDHQVPAESVKAAELHKTMRNFAKTQGLKIYDVGRGGICHQVMPDQGHVTPGNVIIGADSHTCTYGAFGAFATGVGSTEAAAAMATGKIWFKIPPTIKIQVNGKFKKYIAPKDLILNIIGTLSVDGAIYKAAEFTGPTIKAMSIPGRMTLCNMAVEFGAKNGIIAPDETTVEYLTGKIKKMPNIKALQSDKDAQYERTVEIDVSKLEPQVACPSSVDNVKPVSEIGNVAIDQAFIGSCTNGRLEDLRVAAKVMKGKKVKDGVRALIIPASQEIWKQANDEGLLQIFTEAGAVVCGSACGPCLGGHIGLLAAGETCVSSSNRNFIGRMGSPQASVYLASPATVAASAIAGKIVSAVEVKA